MRIKFTAVLTVIILLTNSSGAIAQAASVKELLEQDNPASALDALGSAERGEMVTQLVDALALAQYDRKLEIATALCKSNAWLTGDDDAVQGRIWAQMIKTPSAQDPLTYALDCAAVNRDGYLRARTLTPLFKMQLSYCAGEPLGKDMIYELEQFENGMKEFSVLVDVGLTRAFAETTEDQKLYSFFSLRTELRLATVRAAQAVQLAKDDWKAAQAKFWRAAEGLREREPESYRLTWGAWRYRNDIAFYSNFYAWLGGVEALDMTQFEMWPEVIGNDELYSEVPDNLLNEMTAQVEERKSHGHNGDPYVDWIYMDRLLPGASVNSGEECGNWRKRFYNTRKLAKQISACAQDGAPMNYASLQEFDACVHEFQTDDWSVQYMTTHKSDLEAAKRVINKFIDDLSDENPFVKLDLDQNERAFDVLRSFKAYDVKDDADLVRIVSDQGLTTDMRSALRTLIDSESVPLPWGTRPLFRRPTHF